MARPLPTPTMIRRVRSHAGWWTVAGDANSLQRVYLPHESAPAAIRGSVSGATEAAVSQLAEYFSGNRRTFTVTLDPLIGTEFQRDVWAALRAIPFGETRTYGDVAVQSGHPGAQRAVGQANGANPWPIIVPCHRVVASTGLGGYAGGLEVKRFLLELEGAL